VIIFPKGRLKTHLMQNGKWWLVFFTVDVQALDEQVKHAKKHHPEEDTERLRERALFRMGARKAFPWKALAIVAILLLAAKSFAQNPTDIVRVGGVKVDPAEGILVKCPACPTGGAAGGATEAKQDDEITGLADILAQLALIKAKTDNLDVALSSVNSGLATAAKQDTGNTSLSSIDGKIPASPATTGKQDTGNTSLSSIDGKIVLPGALDGSGYLKVHEQGVPHVVADAGSTTAVSGNVASTVADGANVTLGTQTDAKSTATDTTAVSVVSLLKEISAKEQAPSSRAVTVVSGGLALGSVASGAIAAGAVAAGAFVSGALGDNAIATLGAKGDAKSTATDVTAVSVMQVMKEISFMEQNPASRAVTNAGTFAVQATLAAETTKVIGTVNQGTSPWVVGGAVTGSGNFASTVADGANVVLGAKADAKSTATDTTAVTIMSVLKEISAMEQAPASRAVTNAGTFAVQATVASGGLASGSVASGAVASGAVASGAFASGSISDGADVTLGAKADAKSTATDTTAVTVMSVLKEISAMEQAPAALAAGTNTIGSVKLTDGTNVATVKAASTAAAAADTATVVVQSPNGTNPCVNPSATLASVSATTSGTANVQLIALSGTTKIYVCSMSVVGQSGTGPTFSLISGTGSACANGATTRVPAFSTPANTMFSFAAPVAVTPAGDALCYKDAGTSPVQIVTITYVQQ
jgi:hypothetical protein